jgi:hypothetical protein
MKGSTKMADSDGFLEKFTKEHRTKIVPLRWFANLCEMPAHYHLGKVLYLDDQESYGFRYRYHSKLSHWFYKPYFKWGTVYKLDLNNPKIIDKAWDKE